MITLCLRITGILALLVGLLACEPAPRFTQLESLQTDGELRVGTLYSHQVFYYDQHDQASGLEYELLQDFANYLGLKLKMVPLYTQAELYRALKSHQVDMIAAALSPTLPLANSFRFSPEIYQVDTKVVYKKNTQRPRNIEQIDSPLWVSGSSYHQDLLKRLQQQHPQLETKLSEQLDNSELLRGVIEEDIRYALVDHTTLALHQRYFPELAEAFTLSQGKPIVWMLNKSQEDSFYSAMVEFIGQQHSNSNIARLVERYFGHIEKFDYVDTRAFLRAAESRLPKYEAWFKQYAGELDWQLLAAVAYQESHWRADARSYTGVRGLMMLTLDTADFVGVTNRIDPEQSIRGGATYLQQLVKRIPDSIPDNEKIWFALASYNIGFGHVLDARRITQYRSGNPDSWAEVKENLPLLMRKEWYKQTRYGYARGEEAYRYVNNIRQYYQSLKWLGEQQHKQQRSQALHDSQSKIDRWHPAQSSDYYRQQMTEESNDASQNSSE